LRRTVLVLAVTLLLPLASAYAAPAKRSESGIQAIQISEWSRTLMRSVNELLSFLRPATEADAWPPGQKPGNRETANREGTGADPHGRP
jgi:hypothetical protein